MFRNRFRSHWFNLTTVVLLLIGSVVTAAPAPESADQPGEVTVDFWHCQDFWKPDAGVGYTLLQEFNTENAGEVQVNLTWIPCNAYGQALQTAFAGSDMPDVFFSAAQFNLIELSSQELVSPVSDVVPADWEARFAEGAFVEGVNMLNGDIYSWPERGPWHRGLMYINKDVLEAAGLDPEFVPQTWDELREAAAEVTAAGGGNFYGIVFGGADDGIQNLQTFAIAADPSIHGDWAESWRSYFDFSTGTYRFNSDGMQDAIQYWLDLDADGSVLPGVLTMDKGTARALWAEGVAAFHFEPQWVINITKRNYPDTDFAIANVPTPDGSPAYFPTPFAKADYFVSSTTEHPEETGMVIDQLLTREEVFQTFIENGIVLTANALANSNTALYPHEQFARYVQLSDQAITVPPSVGALNPDAEAAAANMFVSPTTQEKLKEIWASGGRNLSAVLDEYNQMLESALDEAVSDAQADGLTVTREDFIFSNWDPTLNYTVDDYESARASR